MCFMKKQHTGVFKHKNTRIQAPNNHVFFLNLAHVFFGSLGNTRVAVQKENPCVFSLTSTQIPLGEKPCVLGESSTRILWLL